LKYKLMPHQEIGADFLAERRVALLLDEPGVGKSGQAIAAADRIKAERVLILSPALVRNHWANTAEQQQDIERPVVVIASPQDVIPAKGPCVCIVSHAALVQKRRAYELFGVDPFDTIIVDESAEFRRFEAQRTGVLLADQGLWTRANHIWFLTGTPIVNSAADLYPISYGPLRRFYGDAPTWFDFVRRFAELRPDGREGWKASGVKNPEELAAVFRPFCLRRTLQSAGIDLPPLTIQNKPVYIDDSVYDEIAPVLEKWTPQQVSDMLETQDEIRDNEMSRVRRILGVAKSAAVTQHVMETAKPSVIFFQHTSVRDLIGQSLADQGRRVSYIDGSSTRKQLTAAVDWFQKGALDALLVQTQAGGMGLTLTRSQNAIVAEQPWTATALFQAIKRVHRITQEKPVTADVLQASGCWLDEIMATVIQRKHVAAQSFLDLLTATH
jgi:SWI/SNF-related matrix-associated actin-dependent regulator 1 of chromatin subfamily A